MTLFRVPKLPGDTPPGLGSVLGNAFKQLYADLQALFNVPGDIAIRTASYRPVAGETVRVSPPAAGMGFILPTPSADNRGQTITAILESPEGALRVFVSPGSSPTGNGLGVPTIDGAEMASFTAAGALPFVSNGVDKWSVARGPAGATGAPGPAPTIQPGSFVGLQVDAAGAAAALEITGAEAGESIRSANSITDITATGTIGVYPIAEATNNIFITALSDTTIQGATALSEGKDVMFYNAGTHTLTFVQESGSVAANTRFSVPDSVSLTLIIGNAATFRYTAARWRCIANTH